MTLRTTIPSGRVALALATSGILAGAVLQAVTAVSAAASPVTAPYAAPAVAGVAAAPHAVAIGKLAASGCAQSSGAASCDLYAMTGTTSVLGQPVPIWGFSTTGAAGSATAPGPVLAVAQGSAVTITLHNQLDEAVSLALPGQATAAFSGSLGDDTDGAASNTTRTYTFTANRPGTFLYEAGHTADGARQVAMGLAGALVVLPADGTAYGSPDTSYHDDGVLVLSEIDPALNAHPASFDMRNFAPKYRLINGKPFPASDPISTDQGHKVLVRYVNVGAQTHAMSVLGATQLEVAEDGHPMKYATTVNAESIDPGETLDTIVTMPTGPEAKLAVYEAAEHLDNNAQFTADPQQLAFGGMMTFLDTNAPPPSADAVGPVSTHITASPNPSDGLSDVTVTADLSDATTGGANVSQAEFVVDDAVTTGVGFGVPMTGPFGTVDVANATGTLPAGGSALDCNPATGPVPVALSCLSAGKHTIFVRALDATGNWGVIGSVIFNLPKTGPQTTNGSLASTPANGASDVAISTTGDDSDAGGTITNAEYFLDSVGLNGTGTALGLNRVATVVSEDGVLAAADVHALTEGTHQILVHSKDSLGLWGPVLALSLVVDTTGPGVDAASVGPNPTNGVIGDKSNPTSLLVSGQLTDRDSGGALQGKLVAAEAFLDKTTGAPGTGLQLIAIDGKMDSTTEAVYGLIPLSQVRALPDGTHHVYVRGKDDAGNWGNLFAANLIVDKTAPVLGTLTASPNPTNGASTLTATATVTDASPMSGVEYWFGSTDPGVGRGSSVPVFSVVGTTVVATVPLAGVAAGPQLLNLRVKDLAGNWSKSVSTTVTVVRPNPIFSSTFETANLTDWSARTGAVLRSGAAKLPVAGVEPTSLNGLQATVSTTTRASYVTDDTPSVETTYHARFRFNRNTLTTGAATTTALTLFEGRTAAQQGVFAVQYRTVGTTPQLRTAVTGGTAGPWYTLTPGAHTLQVDWTPAGTGSVTLKVDGTSVQTRPGNAAALRIESVRLGVTAGWATGTAGVAFFDSFTSTRNTMP